jgi:chemotaxis protein MotB
MRKINTSILAVSLLALAGTAGAVDWSAICCDGGYEYRHPSAWEKEQQRLRDELAASRLASGDTGKAADELAAADRRIADLEKQLADREREMASLRAEQSAEMAKLKEAERGLVRSLRPQIEKGDITVDLNNERLLINLASAYLFDSGKGELKPDGAEALKHVGAVLKKFPQYKVAVDGHTDNMPIHGFLMARFPTNKELSEARAANAAKALADGGRGDAKTTGYGDTNPVEPNTTAAGRAKNRRVEIRVTE